VLFLIADISIQVSNTGRLYRRISNFHCDVNINSLRAHPRRKRSITAPVDYKNILMIKGDIARHLNAKFGRRGRRGRPRARGARRRLGACGQRAAIQDLKE
jgi:hypothetical protein